MAARLRVDDRIKETKPVIRLTRTVVEMRRRKWLISYQGQSHQQCYQQYYFHVDEEHTIESNNIDVMIFCAYGIAPFIIRKDPRKY